jgi:hypothetical protein
MYPIGRMDGTIGSRGVPQTRNVLSVQLNRQSGPGNRDDIFRQVSVLYPPRIPSCSDTPFEVSYLELHFL